LLAGSVNCLLLLLLLKSEALLSARLSLRVWKKLLVFCWNFLLKATGAGAGAAPAAAGTGGGAGRAGGCVAGGLSLFMTASDPKKSYDL